MSEVILDLEGVRFGYQGSGEVLRGVTLSVRCGTCLCLMGVNGCGKSTLIDCVLGASRPASGRIRIAGHPASSLKPAQMARLVSYVPQVHERSFPYLVEHIVLMGRTAHARGIGAPDFGDVELALRALEQCGIARLAKRPYTSLSGGEMQMVMLARALAQQTELVLMDEPTAHLDFKNELLFLETVERLVEEGGVTVLMATHAPNQAFHLANAGVPTRVALMCGGSIHAEGSPREVLTEETVRDVYGIEARLLVREPQSEEERLIRQLVPQRTVDRGVAGQAGSTGKDEAW